jgi:hypothetical protein
MENLIIEQHNDKWLVFDSDGVCIGESDTEHGALSRAKAKILLDIKLLKGKFFEIENKIQALKVDSDYFTFGLDGIGGDINDAIK